MFEAGGRRRSVVLAAGVAATALAVAGCGGAHPTISPTSAAHQIATQIRDRYHTDQVQVSCPGGVAAERGRRFVCRATIAGQAVDMEAVVTSGGGQFSVTPAEPIVEMSAVVSRLESEIAQKAGVRPSVTCPQKPVLVVPVGGRFECRATFGQQPPRRVEVTIVDARGDFGFQLSAAG